MDKKPTDKYKLVSIIIAIGAIVLAGFSYYTWSQYANLKKVLVEKEAIIVTKETELANLTQENQNLNEALVNEQNKNGSFEAQIKQIASTVGNLNKLSQTDPELLQKYSKVYFLSENYVPSELTEIPSQYLYNQTRVLQIHTKAWPFLEDLLQTAQADGIELQILSAYRSFGTQSVLKTGYNITYGVGTANQFSADQGYSEHQLGTTLDFTTPETGSDFGAFKNTEAYTWLKNNAHKYGFILSYPEGNQFYQFEPWHWRFVGTALALRLHEAGENFYDLSQREIDGYLISIFD